MTARCVLCRSTDRGLVSDYLRPYRWDGARFDPTLFRPYLTPDELVDLRPGTGFICAIRWRCRNRQRQPDRVPS